MSEFGPEQPIKSASKDWRPLSTKNIVVDEKSGVGKKSIRIMSINLMRDMWHKCTWKERVPKIIRLIELKNPDIIGFQECIDIPNHPLTEFLDELKKIGYRVDVHFDFSPNNKIKLAVVNAWKKEKHIKKIFYRTLWLSPTPWSSVPATSWGQKIARPIGVNAFRIRGFMHPLCIVNTHFGHSSFEKERSAELLPGLIQSLLNVPHSTIFLGDFNETTQKLENGEKVKDVDVKKIICESNPAFQMREFTGTAITDIGSISPGGNFFSTEDDSHPTPLNEIGDQLDLFFGHNVDIAGPVQICDQTFETPIPPFCSKRGVYVSDHMPICADFVECFSINLQTV